MSAGQDPATSGLGAGFAARLYSVSPYGNLTGAPISAVNHARLMRSSFESSCLVLSQAGPIQVRAAQAELPVLLLPIDNRGMRARLFRRTLVRDAAAVLGSRWRYFRGLGRELRQAPGIVHVHSSVSIAPLALGAAKLCGMPSVLHIRESARSRAGRLWMRCLAGLATTVVCVSEGVRQGYGQRIRCRSRVIHNFMEMPAPPPPKNNPVPRVVLVAKLSRGKGADLFVQACRRLRDAGISFEALLVGEWVRDAERAEAEGYIREHRLGDRIRLAGQQADMAPVYAAMDVLLLPTRRDSFPRVVMEAMAHGIPVVASKVDGTPEMVEEGVTGFLVDPGDVDGYAAAVRRLLQDPDLRRRMGAAGRVRAQTLFSPEAYAEAMRSLYREIARPA